MATIENGRFYLARRTSLREIELVDGGHADPESVTKAARVFKLVYADEGPWVMAEVHAMPELTTVNDVADDEPVFYGKMGGR